MTVQTSYTRLHATAFVGLIFAQAPKNVISRAVENGPIEFGIAVSRGSDPDKQVVPGGAAGFSGISARALDSEGAANTGALAYKDTETAAILSEGYIWAACPSGCVAGDAAKFTNSSGVLDSGNAASGETQIDGFWDSSASAGGLAILRLNSTNV